LYASRYPDLARLKKDADVNFISRNVFARCKNVFLRDGGLEKTALNATMERSVDPLAMSARKTLNNDPELRRLMLEPIPFKEIGPFPHPWRASQPR
jgi:hypothetical protein